MREIYLLFGGREYTVKTASRHGLFTDNDYFNGAELQTGSSHIISADIHRLQMFVLQVVNLHQQVLHLYIFRHLKEFS